MNNFELHNPTRIYFGRDQILKLKSLIPKNANILFIYGQNSIKTHGIYSKIVDQLKPFKVMEFPNVEPNPSVEHLSKAINICKENDINFLICAGGGSVIDATKFISIATHSTQSNDPWYMITKKLPISKAIPFGTILTLPATGSEMNCASVISKKSTKEKIGFIRSEMYPQFSILDPSYTFSLSSEQTANGIIDSFVHVLEQYLTYPVNSPIQDRFAEGILLTLIEEGPKALEFPTEYDIRANIMWSSTVALNGWISPGVPQDWTTHMVGHQLTALFNIPHAQTLAILLPSVMEYQKTKKRDKIIQFAQRVWSLKNNDENLLVDMCISKTRHFFESLGIKTRLSKYGIQRNQLPLVLDALKKQGLVYLGEHQDIRLEDSQKILEISL